MNEIRVRFCESPFKLKLKEHVILDSKYRLLPLCFTVEIDGVNGQEVSISTPKVRLTPVMTAPLDQLRDTSRKESSTALKPMTATDTDTTFNTTVRNSLPGTSHCIRDVDLVRGRDPHSVPLFIRCPHPPDPSLPPSSFPTSETS